MAYPAKLEAGHVPEFEGCPKSRKGDWWRGLDSNQCSLRRQIYSLMDLTTLPPLHILRAGNETRLRSSGRFMVGCRKGVNTLAHLSRKKLVRHAFCGKPGAGGLASLARFALIGASGFALQGGYSSMVEQQPSKLNTRVRFPLPAPVLPIVRL